MRPLRNVAYATVATSAVLLGLLGLGTLMVAARAHVLATALSRWRSGG